MDKGALNFGILFTWIVTVIAWGIAVLGVWYFKIKSVPQKWQEYSRQQFTIAAIVSFCIIQVLLVIVWLSYVEAI